MNGHSICEGCYEQLLTNDCPTCRDQFLGTRNYTVEAMIQELQHIKYALPEPVDAPDGSAEAKKQLAQKIGE